MLSWLDLVGHGFVAVQGQDVSKVVAFAHMTHNLVDSVLALCISEFFCVSLSSAFIDSVVLFLDWLVLRLYELSLGEFNRLCQCS